MIGGYLALEKSCLTKAGSSRKKVSRGNGGEPLAGREREVTGHRAVGLTWDCFLGHLAWLEDGLRDDLSVDQRRPWTGWPCKLQEGLSWGGGILGLGSSRALMVHRGQLA